ncbi:MAG: hypothetical protein U1D30_25700 [Planctomycetota bacterium]
MDKTVRGTPSMTADDRRAVNATESNTKDPSTIDGIMGALYGSISFLPDQAPDWARLRGLFLPGGRLIPPGMNGELGVKVLDVDNFIAWSRDGLNRSELRHQGFHEVEIARQTHRFGNIAHIFSTYEWRHAPSDAEPLGRGINSVQLLWDRGRWWIVTIFWEEENAESPIPDAYLWNGRGRRACDSR